MKEEGYKEIYQRIKKENPCIFCIRSDGGCQFKGNKCDSTSLKKYYERNQLEIESILKDIYIKELDQENEQLKAQIEEMKNCWNCKYYNVGETICLKGKPHNSGGCFKDWELTE